MEKPVVLITGALTGIGRATAVAFAKKGAKVVVAGRRDAAGSALAEELRSLGAEAEFVHADVRKEDDVRGLVDETVTRFGRLDVAVNNAATEGEVGPITEQTAETYAATFETNERASWLPTSAMPSRSPAWRRRPATSASSSTAPVFPGSVPRPTSISRPSAALPRGKKHHTRV
jgi:NAD(P)-dependent dehydrogenase (short-subunit alcohol dehydrogenase family)